MKLLIFFIIGMLFISLNNTPFSQPRVHIVKMEGMRFVPETIEVNAGETVRWINESKMSHNVKAKDKSFKSTMLSSKGEKFEHVFKKAGKYDYYCQPHRFMGMKGTVIVKN